MKHLLTTLVLSITAFSAVARDVIPSSGFKHGSSYVRVTKLTKDRVSFESCVSGYEKLTCEHLGNRMSYSLDKLTNQKGAENLQIAGAVAADIGIILATVFTAGYAGAATGAALYGAGSAGTIGLVVGASAGAVGSGVAISAVDAINPYEQYKQAQTLNSDVVNDKNVKVDDVDAFIKRLDLVLSKF